MKRWNRRLSGGSGTASGSTAAQEQPPFSAARAHTSAEGAKNGYIFLVAAVVPFVLAIILGLGVGYFFAGFQGFAWSVPGVMAYGGGFAVEAVCLACFFAAAKAFWGGARWHFVAALVAALLLSTISIAAQVLYLELDALKGAAEIPPGALDNVPVVGWLVGGNGGGWAEPLGSTWRRRHAALCWRNRRRTQRSGCWRCSASSGRCWSYSGSSALRRWSGAFSSMPLRRSTGWSSSWMHRSG